MKKIRNNYNVIRIKGLNLPSFLNKCIANGISINFLQRYDGFAEFGLNDRDLKTLKKINMDRYDWQVVRYGGWRKFLNVIVYRIGLVAGMILSMTLMLLLNNRLLRIHIDGLSFTAESEVLECIHTYGINTFSSLNFDKTKLEVYLEKEFHFSIVSVTSKGNCLIINVKEKLPSIEDSYVPITSDYNMIIDSIDVHTGTARVKDGEIVYKGDTLVEPFVTRGDDILYVSPVAIINATIYFYSSYKFLNEECITARTGKYKLISSDVYLGKYKLWSSKNNCTFENFEIQNDNMAISGYFLPISINKTYAYELEEKVINRDFEKEKEEILNGVKSDAYDQVPNYLKVDNEDILITNIDGGYIVSVYLSCNYTFEYN